MMRSKFGSLGKLSAALRLRQPWSDMVKHQIKTMELRCCALKKYQGRALGFIQSGTGHVWGEATIVQVVQLTEDTMFAEELLRQHKVSPAAFAEHKARLAKFLKKRPAGMDTKNKQKKKQALFGLKLRDVLAYPEPVPFDRSRRGPVGVLLLDKDPIFVRARTRLLGTGCASVRRPKWRIGILKQIAKKMQGSKE